MKANSAFSVVAAPLFALSGMLANAQLMSSQQNSVPRSDAQLHAQNITPALAVNYGKLPLSFEANQGQSDPEVQFLSRGSGYSLFLTDSAAVLALTKTDTAVHNRLNAPAGSPKPIKVPKIDVVRMVLAGASPGLRVSGTEPLPGMVNYFIGNDPMKWRSKVPTYAKVQYAEVYPGIDLIYYGNQRQLEYDFVVAPGADPKQVRLHFAGAKKLKLNPDGDLEVVARNGEIAFHKPAVYQETAGLRQPVDGSFSLNRRKSVRFKLGAYDHSKPLIIDPVLEYSTYLGAGGGQAIAVDAQGNTYVTGANINDGIPVTAGAFKVNNLSCTAGNICESAYVTKFNAYGTALVYSTYLGGSMGDGTIGWGIAVDSSGNAYITGQTGDTNFPTTPGALQTALHSTNFFNAFATKLNPTGTALEYSTYVGGTGYDIAYGIAADNSGNAYLAGYTTSSDFPVTRGAFQTLSSAPAIGDAFVTKLNPTGTALVYSTFLGGTIAATNTGTTASGIAIDSSGSAYVTGNTSESDFPVTAGAFQTTNKGFANGRGNAFITKFNPAGSALVYSTLLGGSATTYPGESASGDAGNAIALDGSGDAFVTGNTTSTDFPVTPAAFQTTNMGIGSFYGNAFISKLNPSGTALMYSTFLGGPDHLYTGTAGYGIAIDTLGDADVTGQTTSQSFPVTSDALQSTDSAEAFMFTDFVSIVNSTGTGLVYSTYLGGSYADNGTGIAVDTAGSLYVTGAAYSSDFPVTPYAFQGSIGGVASPFVSKFLLTSGSTPTTTSITADANPQAIGAAVTLTASVVPTVGFGVPTGTVTFAANGGAGPTISLNSAGQASYTTSALAAGGNTIVASYSGDATYSVSTGAFVEAVSGSPSYISVVSGSGQTASATPPPTAFTNPLVVLVEDASGTAVPGASVTFSGAGLEFSPATATTNSMGEASVVATPVNTGPLTATANVSGVSTGAVFTLTGTGTAPMVNALQFIPVTPCRVADTRNATGPFGGPEIGAASSREFDIPQSACNIPSTAVAYSVNVTVVPDGSLNYLTLWPTGQMRPLVSTLNSDGRIKANAAIIPAGANGGVSIFVSDATQVILDIEGYFVPAGTTSALAFYPVPPCRVADTRNPVGPLGGPSLPGYTSRAFPIQSSACNLPSTAQAYSLNVTAIPYGTLNYLTSWPTGEAQPYVSTLNSSTGTVTANAAIVAAGSGGEVSIFVSDPAAVILDVNGYFAPPDAGGLSLYTTAPCRVLDTRPNDFFGSAVVDVEASACAPPSAAQAYVLNATVVPTQGGGPLYYLTLWPYQTNQPNVSTLNAYDNAITSNMAIVPATNGSIDAWADGYTNLILDLSSYFAP